MKKGVSDFILTHFFIPKREFMKRIIEYLFLLVAGTTFFACQSDDNGNTGLSGTDIIAFSISGYESANAEINATNHTIYLQLPANVTSGSGLCPLFSLSEGATASIRDEEQISGSTTVNFNRVVTYTITAENGTETDWKVSVTNNDYTIDWGLGHFLADEYAENGAAPDGFYLQQHNTGDYSNDNCGPACAVMAARWATNSSYSGTVEMARNEIEHSSVDNGVAWFPQDILRYLSSHDFNASLRQLPTIENQFVDFVTEELQNGHLLIICLNMSYVTLDNSGRDNNRVNKFYPGEIGHFLVVKGYKIVDGVVWIEVNDPWGLDLKYADGTYKGNNRYYRAGELSMATANHQTNAVVISR